MMIRSRILEREGTECRRRISLLFRRLGVRPSVVKVVLVVAILLLPVVVAFTSTTPSFALARSTTRNTDITFNGHCRQQQKQQQQQQQLYSSSLPNDGEEAVVSSESSLSSLERLVSLQTNQNQIQQIQRKQVIRREPSTIRVERYARLPVWPVWAGVIDFFVGWILGPENGSKLEQYVLGGRVCPMQFDGTATSPFILLVHQYVL